MLNLFLYVMAGVEAGGASGRRGSMARVRMRASNASSLETVALLLTNGLRAAG